MIEINFDSAPAYDTDGNIIAIDTAEGTAEIVYENDGDWWVGNISLNTWQKDHNHMPVVEVETPVRPVEQLRAYQSWITHTHENRIEDLVSLAIENNAIDEREPVYNYA